MASLQFVEIDLPNLKNPAEVPAIDRAVFQKRFDQLEAARSEAGLDFILIYADREHSANLAWLTGFDPRFEEALWIQGQTSKPMLLLGNENIGFAPSEIKLDAQFWLYQPFGLPNQDQSLSSDLVALLRKAGLQKGVRCGVVGWKPLPQPEVPYWIVEAIHDVTGEIPINASGMLMNPRDGLRTTMEPEMIRFCEYASSITSNAIRTWVENLEEGITERESARHFVSFGLELSCHPMVNFGRPIPSGLKSPRNGRAHRGQYAQGAFGVIGALTCRAGRLVEAGDADEDSYLELVTNYLEVVRRWYSKICVGAIAGEVVAAAVSQKSDRWEFALNPGHMLHLDEWLASPFFPGSDIKLRSGYAIRQDIIPIPSQGQATINMEDGFVLADEDLQNQLWHLDRAMMERSMARRALMAKLGYEVHPDVLPLSNIAGAFFPFLLEPKYAAQFS